MSKTTIEEQITIIVAKIILILLIIPLLNFIIGYIIGWISKIIIGKWLVKGIATLFGRNISIDNIPLIAGLLSWIGGFFKIPEINDFK